MMNMKTIPLIILLVFYPLSVFAFGATATVDKTEITLEDSIFFSVEVEGGKAAVDLSPIKNFRVISKGSSSSYNFINGRSERKSTYQYVLMPLAKGNFRIPPIGVTMDGQTVFTNPIDISVKQETSDKGEFKPLFAEASVEKENIFVGEQTVFTLRFFTSKRIVGAGFETPPEFKGFSVKQFEEEKNFTRTIKGVRFNVTEVDYLIIPAKPGEFTINPVSLVARVVVPSDLNSFFMSDQSKPVRVVSNPVRITVTAVPEYQGDGEYSGLTGKFDIQADIDKKEIRTGESGTITYKISGSGNIMDAALPRIVIDEDRFKVYDDNPVEETKLTARGYEGFKLFKKAVVPLKQGEYTVPSISLTYFDVEKRGFQTIFTEEIHINALPSVMAEQQPENITAAPKKKHLKKDVSYLNKDILEIKEGLDVLNDYNEIPPFLFFIGLMIPGVLFGALKVFLAGTRQSVSMEKQMKEKARQHLKQAGKMKAQGEDFMARLYSCIVALIYSKAGRTGETITVQEAGKILKDAGMEESKAGEITGLIEDIEGARFGGKLIDEKIAAQFLTRTRQIAKLFSIAVFTISVFHLSSGYAVAGNESGVSSESGIAAAYIEAIQNYKQGNFSAAAEQFETIAKRGIKNPFLYYNIGNAYLKTQDTGHAVLWYERAKRLLPGDPDLNFNLDYSRTLVKDKQEQGIDVLKIIFFWENLIPVKFLQGMALLFSFVFFIFAGIKTVKQQDVFSSTGILLILIPAFLIFINSVNYYRIAVLKEAVITSDQAFIHSGASEVSTKLFTLHSGTKIKVLEKRGQYLKIKFSKDKMGWISTDKAEII